MGMESFSCQCKDGFLGNGYTCFEEPSDCNKTCHVDKLAILREFCDCKKDVNMTTMGPTTPYETTTSQFIVGNTTSEPVITNATTSTLTNTTTMPHMTTMPHTDGPTTSSEPIITNATTIQTTMPHTDGPTTLVTNGTTTQSTTMTTTTTATTTTTEPTTTMEPLTCKYYVILLLIEL